jgi:hypothetical protein
MIEAFFKKVAPPLCDALASKARLQYDASVKRCGPDHDSTRGRDVSVNLAWWSERDIALRVVRVLRMIKLDILERCWPCLVSDSGLPDPPGIFEVAKVCSRKARVTPPISRSILSEASMHRRRNGRCKVGAQHLINGKLEHAFLEPVGPIRPPWHCDCVEIGPRVLAPEPESFGVRSVA